MGNKVMKLVDADEFIKRYLEMPQHEEVYIMKNILDEMPKIDPVPHGKWKLQQVRQGMSLVCSLCYSDSGSTYETEFCPNCGAKMEV